MTMLLNCAFVTVGSLNNRNKVKTEFVDDEQSGRELEACRFFAQEVTRA